MPRGFLFPTRNTSFGLVCLVILAGCRGNGHFSISEGGSSASTQGSALLPSSGGSSGNSSSLIHLTITPGSGNLGIGRQIAFKTSGGIPPYKYSVLSGVGTIAPDGTFSAGYAPGASKILIQDTAGHQGTADVQVGVGTSLSPNDQLYGQQYALHNSNGADIRAPEAWAINTDCSSVLVAILDTGVDYNHPDLAGNLYHNPKETPGNGIDDDGNGLVDDYQGWNFVTSGNAATPNGTNDPKDDHFHGTHIAGIIGAATNNLSGTAGICWKASMVPIKAFDQHGSGFSSDAISGIDYAISLKAKIINASFDFPGTSSSLQQALDRANAAGILVVSAAGNAAANNDTTPTYPASYVSPNIIAVAATNASDALASYSNFGATSVHIAAPGDQILSTFPTYVTADMTTDRLGTNYQSISGTSMATPMVSGAAALLWSFEPSLSMTEVRDRILSRADVLGSLNGKVQNGRRLNLRKILYAQ